MENYELVKIREQLNDRRIRLTRAIPATKEPHNLVSLLQKVDAALERMDAGIYGLCEVCHDPINENLLKADPLITLCLGDLNENQQRILEQDINLASQIQSSLLPKNHLFEFGTEISYHYQPAGPVSGDYCDIVIDVQNENILFVLGDISGKGIAASMLMTHVHALVHSLIGFNLPVNEMMGKINRIFCESSLYSHFITMVLGKIYKDGKVEIANAGHCLPLIIKQNNLISLDSTGMPLGIFQSGEYSKSDFYLDCGETILIYTDGLSEANLDELEYSVERINNIASKNFNVQPKQLINLFLDDVYGFTKKINFRDDLSILAIHRKHELPN
jgi:sigma-B regulation protein RsbU (phosphoserine phosphatase)